MADSTEQVAVESAATAVSASENAAQQAVVAQVAAEEAKEAAMDAVIGATVTLAEQAVEIAHNEATIANQQAAMVTQAAVEAIAQNEEKESWQDAAIKRLSAESETNSTMLQSVTAELAAIKSALLILTEPKTDSLPSTPTETPPTVATETVMESTVTEPLPRNGEENRDRETEARKRILRFL